MGYGAVLAELGKERLWSIDVDDSVADPADLARRLARELVNENKESYKATVDSIDFEDGYVPVKVGLRIEDAEAISAQNRLRNRLGFDMVRSVERSSIWKLSLRAEEPERTAEEIAEGLLINPHKDYYEIMR
jgi:phosphoribosylformylglycinamidine (FGAM) synthase PurS component